MTFDLFHYGLMAAVFVTTSLMLVFAELLYRKSEKKAHWSLS